MIEQAAGTDQQVEGHLLRARALLEEGNVPAAIDACEQALAIAPHMPALHATLAAVLEGADDLQGALREYMAALKLNPREARYARAVVSLRVRLGNGQTRPLAGAVTMPLSRRPLPPPPAPIPPSVVAMVRALRSTEVAPEDRGWVIAGLRAAITDDPENARLHVTLSNLLQAEGDREGAATHMREANRLGRTRAARQA
jgi:Flp pilus assembly protein TadD